MHDLILNAARKIFLEKGYDNTSIRNIAEAIEYSPGTIYFYFKDKAEIFYYLYVEGFQKFSALLSGLSSIEDPFERLKAMGRIYIEFAQQNMDYYNLMFLVKETFNAENAWEIANGAFEMLRSLVQECKEKGYFKDLDGNYLCFMIFATVHGMCSLPFTNRINIYKDREKKDLLAEGSEIFFKMMERV